KDGSELKGGFGLGGVPDTSSLTSGIGMYKYIPGGAANITLANSGEMRYVYIDSDKTIGFGIIEDGFSFETTQTDSKDFNSNKDFSEVEPENKLIYAQRSYVDNFYKSVAGYDDAATQSLKNIAGVLTWVTD